jgi:hypothetical protein
MILFRATPPPVHVVQFFESLFPGFWIRWLGAADSALREIAADAGGDTIITSWFRSPGHNQEVGGNPDSQHLVGLALDIIPGKPSLGFAINEAAARFTEAGFVTVPAPTHLHIQTFPAGLLRRVGVLDALSV